MSKDDKKPIEEFAKGLPEWDLKPPHMVIRRVKRKNEKTRNI